MRGKQRVQRGGVLIKECLHELPAQGAGAEGAEDVRVRIASEAQGEQLRAQGLQQQGEMGIAVLKPFSEIILQRSGQSGTASAGGKRQRDGTPAKAAV